jgi:hypothetical protein
MPEMIVEGPVVPPRFDLSSRMRTECKAVCNARRAGSGKLWHFAQSHQRADGVWLTAGVPLTSARRP